MPMSETKRVTPSAPRGLAHAGEVAQWTVLLLGWLWLGEQGMRLGWSMASGVLAVAVWGWRLAAGPQCLPAGFVGRAADRRGSVRLRAWQDGGPA